MPCRTCIFQTHFAKADIRDVLESILSSKDRDQVVDDIHAKLRIVGEKVRKGEYSLDKFVINKVS